MFSSPIERAVDVIPVVSKSASSTEVMQSEDGLSMDGTVPSTVIVEDDFSDVIHSTGEVLIRSDCLDDLPHTVHDEEEEKFLCIGDDSLSDANEETGECDANYFDDVLAISPLSESNSPPQSILKRTASELFLIDKSSAWKQLPRPDIAKVRALSCPVTGGEKIAAVERTSKRVSFHTIQIRSYAQTLGDNPCVSYGPPIALDWHFEEACPIDVELYEAKRGPRRSLKQMMLNYYHRMSILTYKVGCSETELKKAQNATNRAKFQRSLTRALLPCSKIEEVMQSAGRKVRRLSTSSSKKHR